MQIVAVIQISVLIFLSLLSTTAARNLYNPSKYNDCNVFNGTSSFDAQRQAFSDQWKACLKSNPASASPSHRNFAFGFQTTCFGKSSLICGPIMQKKCALETKARKIQQICLSRLKAKKLQEATLKQRQKEFTNRQKHAEREKLEQLQAIRRQQHTDFNRIQKYKDSSLLAGVLGGRAMTGTIPPANGSFYLSNLISQIGARQLTASHADAFMLLQSQFSNFGHTSNDKFVFSENSPYPSRSQLTTIYRKYGALHSLLEEVRSKDHSLPLGNKSVVGTVHGAMLSEIIKAQAAGTLRGNFADSLTGFVQMQIRGRNRSLDASDEISLDKENSQRSLAIIKEFEAQDAVAAELKRRRNAARRKEQRRKVNLQARKRISKRRNTKQATTNSGVYYLGGNSFSGCIRSNWILSKSNIGMSPENCPGSVRCVYSNGKVRRYPPIGGGFMLHTSNYGTVSCRLER